MDESEASKVQLTASRRRRVQKLGIVMGNETVDAKQKTSPPPQLLLLASSCLLGQCTYQSVSHLTLFSIVSYFCFHLHMNPCRSQSILGEASYSHNMQKETLSCYVIGKKLPTGYALQTSSPCCNGIRNCY